MPSTNNCPMGWGQAKSFAGLSCLITGGAGFIGSHLLQALLSLGAKVKVLDDLSTGRLENFKEIASKRNFDFVQGSISNKKLLNDLCENTDLVFHLAGLVAVPESLENPRRCIKLNDIAVFNLYEAAAKAKVRRLIFSSSSAVYGGIDAPHSEDLCPKPATPYALHKLLGEHYGLFFHQYHNLESVYLRYFNVYGPRQLPDSPYSGVISLFMNCLRKQQTATIFGDGSQTRDFVFVDDVVRANLAAATSPEAVGESINVGSGQLSSILDLYKKLTVLVQQKNLEAIFAPFRQGDILHSYGPVDKATHLLKIKAEINLNEGLERTWRWFTRTC